MRKLKKQQKICPECKTPIAQTSTYCRSCCKKGKRNPAIKGNRNFYGKNNPAHKHGLSLEQHYCIKCNKSISWRSVARGSYFCASCAKKEIYLDPTKHPNYHDGRSLKENYCIDCGLLLAEYRTIRCLKCETVRRLKNNIWKRCPNKPEIELEKLLNILFPKEYKFVGNGQVVVDWYNPDFINVNGQKKIIEMYGDYWHNLPKNKARDVKRLIAYKKYGYETLIIWEHELKNLEEVSKKVRSFHNDK